MTPPPCSIFQVGDREWWCYEHRQDAQECHPDAPGDDLGAWSGHPPATVITGEPLDERSNWDAYHEGLAAQ